MPSCFLPYQMTQKEVNAMKYTCVCIALIVTLLFAGNVHGETMDGHTMHLDDLPDTTVFYAFACSEQFACLCDAYANTYDWLNLSTREIETSPSVQTIAGVEDGGYRSCMTLISDGKDIYSVVATIRQNGSEAHFEQFELCRIGPDQGEQVVQEINLSEAIFEDEAGEYTLECTDAMMRDGWLCLLFAEEGEGTGFYNQPYLLLAQNITTGARYSYSVADVISLLDFSDTELRYAHYAKDGAELRIAGIYLENGQTKDYGILLEDTYPDCMTYDRENKIIYYTQASRLYGVEAQGAEPKLVANLPMSRAKRLFPLSDAHALAVSDHSAGVVDMDWKMEPAQVKLSATGGYIPQFEVDHPEISIEKKSDMMSEEVVTAVLTRSDTPDLLSLNTASNQVYYALKNRGYLLPVEQPAILDTVAQMYPALQEAVSMDGKICALPLGIQYGDTLGYDLSAAEDLGLDKMPSTWQEMIDLLNCWPEISERNPDIFLFRDFFGWPLRQTVLHYMRVSYDAYRDSSGGTIYYDTPEFYSLMDLYGQIDFERIEAADNVFGEERALFRTAFDWTLGGADMYDGRPLLLAISEEIPVRLSATIRVLAINPNSRNPESCLLYMQYASEHLSAEDRLMMMPGFNEPQRADDYEEVLLQTQTNIRQLEEEIRKAAPDADVMDLKAQLESQQTFMKELEDAWVISPNDIEAYRAFAEQICFSDPIAVSEDDLDVLEDIRRRFEAGEMSRDQFVHDMDRRIQMNLQEN